jgi:Domain of unknown function (DUF4783)
MNFIICALMTLTLWSSPTTPRADVTLAETVRTSLASGNARQLSAHFAKTVELVIDAEKVGFSSVAATHAEIILRSFFRKYPPHGFQFVYRGSSEQLLYSTGTYETRGQTFDVYVLMRQTRDRRFVINALHFRRE